MTTYETERTATQASETVPTDRVLADTFDAFWSAVTDNDGPSTISFDRCVDWLLDLFQVTTDTRLQVLISEVLDELREIGPVDGVFEDVVLGALASVEAAFDVVADEAGTTR